MERTTLKRHPERGVLDRAAQLAVIDEALVCHLGVVTAEGPLVLPMAHARIDDTLYLHGAIANGILRAGARANAACATFTLLDGLVFARSHFAHSMNFRCVVAFGTLNEVTAREEKQRALVALVEHAARGRAAQARAATESELQATRVVALSLDTMSMKSRVGPPRDLEEDMRLPYWAGVIPLATTAGAPRREDLGATAPEPRLRYVRPHEPDKARTLNE
jgi:nitroimidazol reductase NimA-like FMN-containing flavoprotein (pyridoxamine 5'-phosphate oxidase superfamily)